MARPARTVRVPRPARLVARAFLGGIIIGTLLLLIPAAKQGPGGADIVTALFTATSAICVTGLTIVDTGEYWSPLGEAIILLLIQAGGLGILTLASVSALLVYRKLRLRRRLETQAEASLLDVGEVRGMVLRIVKFSLAVEAITATILITRLLTLGESPGRALWSGTFHGISAYNHAGFSLESDSITRYATDPWISITLIVAVIIGGLGFPVIFELLRRKKARSWSLHTKLALSVTTLLFIGGSIVLTISEWTNPRTLGELPTGGKLLAGTFMGVMPRSAGLNSVDTAGLTEASMLITDILMFIGGSPGSTAGGIKVTTFALLAYVIWAELRGEEDVTLFERRVPTAAFRQALTVALLSVGLVVLGTLTLLALTGEALGLVLFETISAFSTTGLSVGVAGEAGPAGQIVLVILMYLGRIGPLTLGTAIALREKERLYRYAEERPIIA